MKVSQCSAVRQSDSQAGNRCSSGSQAHKGSPERQGSGRVVATTSAASPPSFPPSLGVSENDAMENPSRAAESVLLLIGAVLFFLLFFFLSLCPVSLPS